ncbi:MAG: hypothetical protein DHS20C21_13710 [Gemmatimonadota bacterium]|nr:MAG: hypothetical protein DHS20C21_13710 [Gemmatimonadota bacterium]
MAKRFAYVSFGVLCLVTVHEMEAKDARAGWNADGQIWGTTAFGGGAHLVIASSGEGWSHQPFGAWTRHEELDLPVPVTQVKFVEGAGDPGNFLLVTKDDSVWWFFETGWHQSEPFPGGPVSLGAQSWGETKANFR